MGRILSVLVSLFIPCILAGCGQPKDAIECRMKIKLSGGLDGTYRDRKSTRLNSSHYS